MKLTNFAELYCEQNKLNKRNRLLKNINWVLAESLKFFQWHTYWVNFISIKGFRIVLFAKVFNYTTCSKVKISELRPFMCDKKLYCIFQLVSNFNILSVSFVLDGKTICSLSSSLSTMTCLKFLTAITALLTSIL